MDASLAIVKPIMIMIMMKPQFNATNVELVPAVIVMTLFTVAIHVLMAIFW